MKGFFFFFLMNEIKKGIEGNWPKEYGHFQETFNGPHLSPYTTGS